MRDAHPGEGEVRRPLLLRQRGPRGGVSEHGRSQRGPPNPAPLGPSEAAALKHSTAWGGKARMFDRNPERGWRVQAMGGPA